MTRGTESVRRRRVPQTVAVTCCLCLCLSASGVAGGAPAPPLRVITSLVPVSVKFGDPISAEVQVDFDPSVVSASSISVEPGLTPFVTESTPALRVVSAGVARLRYSMICVTDNCLPIHGKRVVHLAPVTVTARAGSRTLSAAGRWQPVTVSSRLSPSALTGRVRFRIPAGPPAPGYRLAPGTLVAALVAAAALCILAAAIIAGPAFSRSRRRIAATPLSPFDLAIAYVRDSTARSDPDRRRALAYLSETIREAGADPGVATASDSTAWSEPPPTAGTATELAERAVVARRSLER